MDFLIGWYIHRPIVYILKGTYFLKGTVHFNVRVFITFLFNKLPQIEGRVSEKVLIN